MMFKSLRIELEFCSIMWTSYGKENNKFILLIKIPFLPLIFPTIIVKIDGKRANTLVEKRRDEILCVELWSRGVTEINSRSCCASQVYCCGYKGKLIKKNKQIVETNKERNLSKPWFVNQSSTASLASFNDLFCPIRRIPSLRTLVIATCWPRRQV